MYIDIYEFIGMASVAESCVAGCLSWTSVFVGIPKK